VSSLTKSADPADTNVVHLRWQTAVLLTLLVAVATFAVVDRSRGAHEGRDGASVLESRPPTAAQLDSAWASIQPPRGFHRSSNCWQSVKPPEFCLVHYPSVPLTAGLFARWRKEAVPASASAPTGYPESTASCSRPLGRRTVRFKTCGVGEVMVHGQLFTVTAVAPVILKHGKPQATTANLTRYQLRGTQISFRDAGYPAAQER
jgi:hypothetical protein